MMTADINDGMNNAHLERTYKELANGKISVPEFLEINKGQHYGGHFINQANNSGLIPTQYRERTIRALAVPNAFRGRAMANFLVNASSDERDYAINLIKNDYNTLSELIKESVVGFKSLISIMKNLNIKQEGYDEIQVAIVEWFSKGSLGANREGRKMVLEHLVKDVGAILYLAEKDSLSEEELDFVYELCHEQLFKTSKRNLKKLFFLCDYFQNQITDEELETLADKIISKTDISMANEMLQWDVISNNVKGKLDGMLVAARLMGKKK
jgi:hypothetical protein